MVGLLGALAVVLLLIVIVMIARTTELASLLKDGKFDYKKPSDVNGWLFLIFLFLFMGGIVYSGYLFIPLMLPEAASHYGKEIDQLFTVTLFFTGLVFVITHIVLLWCAFKYRESENNKPYFFPHSNTLELIWTSIPAVAMTILVVMGLKTWYGIFDSPKEWEEQGVEPLVIELTAKQFKWIIRYPGVDGEFGERVFEKKYINSYNELGVNFDEDKARDDIIDAEALYLVKGKPTIMKLGALDVLHGFYLPHFRAKMDCVPGIPTSFPFTPDYTTEEYRQLLKESGNSYWTDVDPETGEPRWKNFNFELACTELCGKSHYAMQKYVYVVTQEEYDAWLAAQTPYFNNVAEKLGYDAPPAPKEVPAPEDLDAEMNEGEGEMEGEEAADDEDAVAELVK